MPEPPPGVILSSGNTLRVLHAFIARCLRVGRAVWFLILLATPLAVPIAAAEDRLIEIRAGTRGDGTMFFEPDDVTVATGDRVTLRLVNDDPLPHDIVIKGIHLLAIEIELRAHETGETTFTPQKPGNFTMFCEIGDHEEQGMRGTFRVTGEPRGAPFPTWTLVAALAVAALTPGARRRSGR